ncbi:MAG: NAD-dependent deacylase [Candidatus Tectomicrobia bacterium]|nr:NAD-dependent deacylase [Candidatus Tectomicrobia bacterium]
MTPSPSPRTLEKLAAARRVAVLTGAGISAESGVPTFRGADGLWRRYRAEDLATPQAFARDPRLVWEWYDWRRQLIAKVEPNAGHLALARLEARCPDFSLITQNVDGLHPKAGSRRLVELHGNIWRLRCTAEQRTLVDARVPLPELPPRCPTCQALARPDVVWFGEALPQAVLEAAFEAAREAEVFLVVGTAAVVQPAASLPLTAKRAGAYVIEVNLEPTPISSSVDESLFAPAGEVLPLLIP